MKRLDALLSREVGTRTANALEAGLGLVTVGDLLYHLPRRYVSLGSLTPFSELAEGEHATVVARVHKTWMLRARNGKELFKAEVGDDTGRTLELTFFGRKGGFGYLKRQLVEGRRALFDGKVDRFNRTWQLTHPRFELLDSADDADAVAARITPIYPASAKVATWQIARAVQQVVTSLQPGDVPEPLPPQERTARGWPTALEALRTLHGPQDLYDLDLARQRLRFDEALVLQAALIRRRAAAVAMPATPRPASLGGLLASFDATLPFQLTDGQREVGEQIAADLARDHPMHRLLQGEVGSGKTLVALRAMLTVVDAGGQAALLAPTEVLATQHHRSITAMLGELAEAGMLPLDGAAGAEFATRVVLLTGSQGAAARRTALTAAADGSAGIVIGTHALIQDTVEFADLGLVVVDEQHRFGVEQRDALRAKAVTTPHLLVMTATPIPRTVAMTVFGDLETSTLSEVPAGRQPVESFVVPADRPTWMARTWAKIREEVDAGRQAFVVCPAIEPAEKKNDEGPQDDWDPSAGQKRRPVTVAETYEQLLAEPALAGVRIAVLHGRMPAEEKDAVMRQMADGSLDVLVATTVIEVGVDVPNASVMVVMDATRFGISQLHQLRGRVGRGAHPGTCLLVAGPDTAEAAFEVLTKVAQTRDGFALSRLDLEVRREGDVLGAAQSGALSSLRLLRVTKDEDVIADARALAHRVLDCDPGLDAHRDLSEAIERMVNPEREAYLERG